MSRILLFLFFLSFLLPAKDVGSPVQYVGGTVDIVSAGEHGKLRTDQQDTLVVATRKLAISIPYERVNLIEYGQNASRRIMLAVVISPMFLLTKARRHFVTIGYKDDEGRQQAMVFRVDKGHVRVVLASLEARTGLRVEYQDDEARKAGKG